MFPRFSSQGEGQDHEVSWNVHRLKTAQINKSVKSFLSLSTCWSGRGNIKKQESGDSKGGKAICLSAGQIKLPKEATLEMSDFFKTESLGTIIEPRCSSRCCGRCPVPGSKYSHREEFELKLIEEGLHYDTNFNLWITSYPYLYSKDMLRGTRGVAMKTMLAVE